MVLTVTSGGDSKTGPTLAPGDIVEVCEGQLMHLQGKVINVEGNVITIMPKHEDLKVHTYIISYTQTDKQIRYSYVYTCTHAYTYVHAKICTACMYIRTCIHTCIMCMCVCM